MTQIYQILKTNILLQLITSQTLDGKERKN